MSEAALSLEPPLEAARPRAPNRVVEFLVTGGLTLVLFPVLWLCRRTLGLDEAELAVGFLTFHAAHVINDPHFSVTYLIFYRDVQRRALGDVWSKAQRGRYWIAGLLVPLVLVGWAGTALASRSAASLGLMMELMFVLVGWHYVKQGFGVLSVLSARRGVQYSALERRAILAHCFAGWAYAWANPSGPAREVEQSGVVYVALARPALLELVSGVAFVGTALAAAWVLARKWRREGTAPPLAPLVGLLVSVWAWTVFSSVDPLMVYLIPALHSVQYLYFVWLLRRGAPPSDDAGFGPSSRQRLVALSLTALVLGWVLFRGAPALLDGAFGGRAGRLSDLQLALGPTPFFAAFFAVVNVHHYFMDHVIWRRENPETRALRQ